MSSLVNIVHNNRRLCCLNIFLKICNAYVVGVEVIKADLDDAESIKQVLSGAYGVFLVTNYWEHTDTDREIQQVRQTSVTWLLQ